MTPMLISTWFVSDGLQDGTFSPQLGVATSNAGAKAIYWRCIVAFYATSLTHNPASPHAFFTNAELPRIGEIDIATLFARWGVEVVRLPITFRLPKGRVSAWGSQFYIFDIIDYISRSRRWPAAIVLDADVVWTKSVSDLQAAVESDGIVTYLHDLDAYPAGAFINGVTREALRDFTNTRMDGALHSPVQYCGGEIFAASLTVTSKVSDVVHTVWDDILRGYSGAPQEEAHLLSAIYALQSWPRGNGNRFIKRMWTTFKHNTIEESDLGLMLWHLPSEKKTGFGTLFAHMLKCGLKNCSPADLELSREFLSKIFGVPRRTAGKFVRDIAIKSIEIANRSLPIS